MSKSAEKHAAPHADVPKYLKQTNPYFQTLANPANVHGVRIPDGGGVETITFTEVVRSTMCSSASAGYEGAATIIGVSQMNKDNEKNPIFPYSLVPACAFKGSAYPYYLGARTTAGNTEYLFTAADFDSPTKFIPHPALSIIASNCTQIRLVSAGIHVYPTCSSLQNAGTLYMAVLPRGLSALNWWTNVADTNTGTMTRAIAKTLPGLVAIPVSDNKGLSAHYVPTDESCNLFAVMSTSDNISADGAEFMKHDTGGFIAFADGLTAGAVISFNIELCFNFEAIPATNAFVPTQGPPVDDPLAMAAGVNMIKEEEPAKRGAGGFDGISSGDHELITSAAYKSVAAVVIPPTKGVRGSQPEVSATSGGIAFHAKPVVHLSRNSPKHMAKMQTRYEKGDTGGDMFSKVLGMVLPLAEKFLPELLALI